jgi:hypothetical protein
LQKDKDGKPLINTVPYNEREKNFVLLTGGTSPTASGGRSATTIQIKKPAYARMLLNPIEDMVNKLSGREVRSATQLGLDLLTNYLPGQFNLDENHKAKSFGLGIASSLNPALGVPAEIATNYNPRYGGRPIVSARQQGVDPAFQGEVNTPEIYKRMGQGGIPGAMAGATLGGTLGGAVAGTKGILAGGAIGALTGAAGFSPQKTEFGVEGLTAGVGQEAARLADIPLGAKKDFPFRGEEALKHTPVIGSLLSRFTGSGVDQSLLSEANKFYGNYDQYQNVKKTLGFLEQTQPQAAPQYRKEHMSELRLADLSQNVESRIADINTQMNKFRELMEQNNSNKEIVDKGYKVLETLAAKKKLMLQNFNSAAQSINSATKSAPSSTPATSNPYGTSTNSGVKP